MSHQQNIFIHAIIKSLLEKSTRDGPNSLSGRLTSEMHSHMNLNMLQFQYVNKKIMNFIFNLTKTLELADVVKKIV